MLGFLWSANLRLVSLDRCSARGKCLGIAANSVIDYKEVTTRFNESFRSSSCLVTAQHLQKKDRSWTGL